MKKLSNVVSANFLVLIVIKNAHGQSWFSIHREHREGEGSLLFHSQVKTERVLDLAKTSTLQVRVLHEDAGGK